jgi:uncharacterized UBP type Zn finger protein
VCFLGAHYLSYIKVIVEGKPLWKLYNDQEIVGYEKWGDIVYKIQEFAT